MAAARNQRVLAGLNGGVAAALVALLAAVALVVKPPAPPGIAEFAPQASKPITKAPRGQTSGNGQGPGACLSGLGCTPSPTARPGAASAAVARPVPTPSGVGVPSSLQCYAWPDGAVTQTFDPQSPPCVASWPDAAKGNGGSTSFGVDGQTIRVSISNPYASAIPAKLVEFFNRHFEMYGRRIVLQTHDVATSSTDDATGQRAAAAKAKELHDFAAVAGANSSNDDLVFLDALARERIIGVNSYTGYLTSAALERLAPYAFSYYPTLDVELRNAGEFLCKAFVGHPAAHAGDVELKSATRSFAVMYPSGSTRPSTSFLLDRLRACGITAVQVTYDGYPDSQDPTNPNTVNTQVALDLKNRKITTVVPLGSTVDFPWFLTAASRVGYHPEWFTTTTADYYPGTYLASPADELASLMGIGYWNKSLPHGESIAFRAFSEVGGTTRTGDTFTNQNDTMYKALLLIASGIQAAGPHLTPATFDVALRSLRFPNPESGIGPHWQAKVGFGNDRAMVDDFSLWSFSSAAPDYDGAAGNAGGAYCYIGRGTRYRDGTWPTSDPGLLVRTNQC